MDYLFVFVCCGYCLLLFSFLGLNAVDNGRVWFHNVKVPRIGGMLDRISQVTESGEYKTAISNLHLRNMATIGGYFLFFPFVFFLFLAFLFPSINRITYANNYRTNFD